MSNWLALWSNGNTAAGWTKKMREKNVRNLYNYFRKHGWNIAPLAAMIGNMEYESYLNPAQWEVGYPIYNGGFGLVQWTPHTNYSSWAGADWETNYDKQMERIQYELENGLQWIPTSVYPFTFREFSKKKKSQMSIADLTRAFEYCYERGTWNNQRITNAEYWYKILKKWETQRIIIYFSEKDDKIRGYFRK